VLGGRYRLEEPLGTGGMSVVWRAHDDVLDRPVAVKLLAGRYASGPSSRRRIHDEARAAAALSHPNIAQVYDFGESAEHGECVPYVVMELVAGRTLDQRLAAGPLPAKVAFRICAEVASSLTAAHADGLVHRDVKPANVMVTPTGAKVIDFGISAAVGPPGVGEPDGELLGTPAYLAPERRRAVRRGQGASGRHHLVPPRSRQRVAGRRWAADPVAPADALRGAATPNAAVTCG
jgi:serine/threonine protein kinase